MKRLNFGSNVTRGSACKGQRFIVWCQGNSGTYVFRKCLAHARETVIVVS